MNKTSANVLHEEQRGNVAPFLPLPLPPLVHFCPRHYVCETTCHVEIKLITRRTIVSVLVMMLLSLQAYGREVIVWRS